MCTPIARECTFPDGCAAAVGTDANIAAMVRGLSLDNGRASALADLCEAIVPGSARCEPVVYIDAKLAMVDEEMRAAALEAIDALAEAAGRGPAAVAELVTTAEFLMIRALAIEAYYSDFVAPGVEGPVAWEEIDFRFPLASQIVHDWSYLGAPE